MPSNTRPQKWIARTSGYQKLLISLLVAGCAFAATYLLDLGNSLRFIIGWDAFALSMISLNLLLFYSATAAQLHDIVKRQDDDIRVIFTIVLSAVCVSLLATVLLILNTEEPAFDKGLETGCTIAAITTSWILLHTLFTIRYAHLYHSYHGLDKKDENGGIDFPGGEAPDYIDFAYFSFVIGMTFQVSDVTITSKTVRRFVLLHSLISFVFNTIIVALTVNIIAGIIK
ncbi:DUF1345 domain-containing protein [Flavobacterium sp. RHBU_24]|uniref:DUF1345 domain-containing protein n=1 Tax=Flavobacterium sp. RHBU_24 TaxID=3391185 RepID=UPI003984921B